MHEGGVSLPLRRDSVAQQEKEDPRVSRLQALSGQRQNEVGAVTLRSDAECGENKFKTNPRSLSSRHASLSTQPQKLQFRFLAGAA